MSWWSRFLQRLPVDLLMRFKCVRKSWYSLIASPKFVVNQLSNQIYDRKNCVLPKCKFLREAAEEESLISFIFSKEENVLSSLSFGYKKERSLGEDHVPVFWKIIQLSIFNDSGLAYILGHCRGIVCLTSDDCRAIVLANPCFRELREFPQSRNRPSHQLPSVRSLCVGFGYDPKLNDYKVLQFRLPGGHAGDDSINRIEVCTLSTDSWRDLNYTNHLGARIVCLQSFECLYFNGACYWIALGYFDGCKAFILSFDMSDEVFRNIRVPSFSSNTAEEPLNFSMLTACHLGTEKLMVFTESLGFHFCDANANTF